jgi:hypothetical protein
MPLKATSRYLASMAASGICALLVAVPAAHADTLIYKFTGKDGIPVYTETLPENYRPGEVQTIKIETLPIDEQRAAIRMLAAMDAKVNARTRARRARLDLADQQVTIAIGNLQQAEANLEKGSIPVAGDRIGKKGGGTRLRESYFLRVSRLQGLVEQAKQALDKAYKERNNLR